jgi:hypothetical protein
MAITISWRRCSAWTGWNPKLRIRRRGIEYPCNGFHFNREGHEVSSEATVCQRTAKSAKIHEKQAIPFFAPFRVFRGAKNPNHYFEQKKTKETKKTIIIKGFLRSLCFLLFKKTTLLFRVFSRLSRLSSFLRILRVLRG